MNDFLHEEIKGYQIQEMLGEGGFGAVYRAYQPLVKREVAIKVILPEYANKADFIRSFETEAQLIARLEHLHIVPLYDYWRDPSGAFLVMRMLRGGSLSESLRDSGPWSTEDTARLLEQIASALSVAHQSRVIHRDLKPGNILLDNDRNAYLSDFGLSIEVTDNNEDDEAGVMVGTPAYIAPEQIQGLEVTPQTDIYSLALIIYEVLTGIQAVQGRNASDLIIKQMSETLPPITSIRNDLPRELDTILHIATAKDPAKRYPNVMAFAAAFKHAIRGERTEEQRFATSDFDKYIVIPAGLEPFSITPEMLDLEAPGIELVNPFKGLRAFQEGDAGDFFGREALTELLINRLKEDVPNRRFLAVVGPSGSGKSSVVKAGVIPAIRRGALPSAKNLFVLEMVPSTDALRELEAALLSIATAPPEDFHERLQGRTEGLHEALAEILPNDGSELFLMIDQFEEVFTQTEDNDVRIHFMDMLQYAVMHPQSRLWVAITIRADFFDKPLMYAEFGQLVRQRFEVVLPLNDEELESTIVGPLRKAGARAEEELVTRIVDDVHDEPGALPLLQYTLTELFDRRQGLLLTLDAYMESGGVLGSLARRAEELYVEMQPEQQEAVRQLFLRLVTLGEGTEDTRRRILYSELVFQREEDDPLQVVLDRFGRYRLLTFDKDPNTREPTVEVAHEALIRRWERLRDWLASSREDLRTQRRLSSSVQEWRNSGGDRSFLALGARLDTFETLMRSQDIALTQDEKDYIKASLERRDEEQRAELARQERERQLEERAKKFLRGLVAVMAVATIGALALAGFALQQRAEAEDARAEAVEQRDAAQAQADANFSLSLAQQARQFPRAGEEEFQAISLVMEANKLPNPPSEVQRALSEIIFQPGAIRRFEGHPAPIWKVDFTTDGTTMVSGGNDGYMFSWDMASGEQINKFGDYAAWIFTVALSPDDTRAVSGFQAGVQPEAIVLWDVATGEEISVITTFGRGHSDSVWDIVWSPDGTQILSASNDSNRSNNLIKWDVETGEIVQRFEGHNGAVYGLDMHPNGQWVVSSSADKSILLWDFETGEVLRRFDGHTGDVFAIAFSPDGSRFVSAGADNSVIVWDTATGEEVRRWENLPSYVRGIDFSADNLIVGGTWGDHSVTVWDVDSGQRLEYFLGHSSLVTGAWFTPDGRTAVSTSVDGIIEWDLYGDGAVTQRYTPEVAERLYDAVVSPNGEYIMAGSQDGRLTVWDAASGDILQEMLPGRSAVNALAFSPDNGSAVSASQDGSLILWDVETGEEIRRFEGSEVPMRAVAFSPDGGLLASGGGNIQISEDRPVDNSIVLWDAATGEEVGRFEGHEAPIRSLAFSPDGIHLLSGSEEGRIILWDVATRTEVRRFEGHANSVLSVVFSADGTHALSGSRDTTVIYWDVATGTAIHQLRGHVAPVRSVVLMPDGITAVSAGGDITGGGNTLIVWNLNLGEEIRRYGGLQGAVRSLALSPDGQNILAASDGGQVTVWRIFSQQELVDWVYANFDVVCQPDPAFGMVDPRCLSTGVASSEEEPEVVAADTEEIVQEEAPVSASNQCQVEPTITIPSETVDTSAFAKDAPYTIGFSNATSTDAEDILIQGWAEFEVDKHPDEIEEFIITNAEGSHDQQLADIQSLLDDGADLLIINPVEQANMSQLELVISAAAEGGVPTVLVNHRINAEDYVSYVGPDDFKVGCLMMQEVIAALDGEGQIIWFNGVDASLSDVGRKTGADEVRKLYPGIGVLNQQPTGLTPEGIQAVAESMVNDNPQIDGIWAYNGLSTLIAEQALVAAGRSPVPAIGDHYLGLTQFAQENNLVSAQVRIPSTMGSQAVLVALDILAGREVSQFIEVQLDVVTTGEVAEFDLNKPANGLLGDYEGLPREFWN